MLLLKMKQATLVALLAFGMSFANAHFESAESWISDIWDHFKEAIDCTSCQALLGSLKLVAAFGDTFMVDVLTGVCTISGAEDHDVCAGVIAGEGPSVHYSLKHLEIGSHTAKTFCASLVGLCQYPKVREYDLAFPAPKPLSSRPPPSGKPPIKVVHFSDTHVDLAYEPGASAELSPAFWHNVTVAMEDDSGIFDDFWARRTRGYQVPSCTGDCISDEICTLRGADAQYNCYVQKVGFSFEKRDDQDEEAREIRTVPECNHAGMAPLLAKIARRAAIARDLEKR